MDEFAQYKRKPSADDEFAQFKRQPTQPDVSYLESASAPLS